jgi:serine/threonine protein kinase
MLMLLSVSSAQAAGEDVSPAVVVIASIFGGTAGFILISIVISHFWKSYKIWREAPVVERDKVVESLDWHHNVGLIPFSDIEFQGADLYRLLHNDDIQTTPRSIESNELKRYHPQMGLDHNADTAGRVSVVPASWNGMAVAVKLIVRGEIDQQQRSIIANEVAEMLTVMHPNCIRVLGLTEQPAQHASLVTEWLHGGTLAELLRRNPCVNEQHRLDLFINVCSAGRFLVPCESLSTTATHPHTFPPAAHIHSETSGAIGIGHRLTPEHVYLTPGGTAKILHFGQLVAAGGGM